VKAKEVEIREFMMKPFSTKGIDKLHSKSLNRKLPIIKPALLKKGEISG
jgi:hypothetical protein